MSNTDNTNSRFRVEVRDLSEPILSPSHLFIIRGMRGLYLEDMGNQAIDLKNWGCQEVVYGGKDKQKAGYRIWPIVILDLTREEEGFMGIKEAIGIAYINKKGEWIYRYGHGHDELRDWHPYKERNMDLESRYVASREEEYFLANPINVEKCNDILDSFLDLDILDTI